jgi:MoCo/4Fe-4S cofactor protein with predicted Tat translocation signal
MSTLDDTRRVMDTLGAMAGKRYWRSLDELAESEAFQELMRAEFPAQADVWTDRPSRRKFLTLMGASLALAGLSGCSIRPAPRGEIVPYVDAPEELVPGKPLFFATTMTFAGSAVGLLAESHEGRPTKIEGNPDHPASRGATDIYHQASVLTLYDPDRSQTPAFQGQTRTWDEAAAALAGAMEKLRQRHGRGLRVLSEAVVSPTLARQMDDLLGQLPAAKWHVYEPVHRDAARRGARLAFGAPVDAVYDFHAADVVLALDADFLFCGPGALRYTADFMERRRVHTTQEAAKTPTNRLYVAETAVTCTGAKADHRVAMPAREIAALARAVAAKVGLPVDGQVATEWERWVAAVAKDLAAHRGRSLVLAGPRQPAHVHLLAHALNDHLGNVGHTVRYIEPVEARPIERVASLTELVADMMAGRVELLVILGGNPVYTAPVDVDFGAALEKVPLSVHHSLYQDETSQRCRWHLPATHFLEQWGDARAYDGTASLVQPLIEPLYQGRSAHEMLALLTGQEQADRELVESFWREHWKSHGGKGSFDIFWQTALHDGVVPDTAFKFKAVALEDEWRQHLGADTKDTALELVFQTDPTLYDGSPANNGWLQELPKPLTTLTWGNAALMSPRRAEQLGVRLGGYAHGGEHGGYHMPVVELRLAGRTLALPAWIMPGHADDSITIYLGHGRTRAGRVGGRDGETVGANAYRLRTAAAPWFAAGLEARRTGATELVACTQEHYLMENRAPVRAGTLTQFQRDPHFATADEEHKEEADAARAGGKLNLYRQFNYDPPRHKWGMSIDLTACIGCGACVVACQAENNIPVVGKEQVSRGREMHWLRIDRYVSGTAEAPEEFHFQPVPCMHCENAPCEYVCPVEATVHSAEGLNEQVYQRCVGTRFCSNNCPYKVRRFNFLEFADFQTPSRRLQFNPDVTVRSRGVMEKCTYCVQRIRKAEIAAEEQGRPIADGEVLTACQAVCPAQAIVFGDINDPQSEVKRAKDSPLDYGLLADLNTAPRTTYLAAIKNPNPELE